jgi:DNA-directed RNA polymerase specialized sigma24 family protein
MGAERVVVPAPTVDDPGSFDDFYRREWPGAVRLAHLLTGVDAVAEDLAQESFTRIEPLPFRQRAVLVLRYYHDLPEDEIAAALGCRPGTVKSLSARALQQLRKVVER